MGSDVESRFGKNLSTCTLKVIEENLDEVRPYSEGGLSLEMIQQGERPIMDFSLLSHRKGVSCLGLNPWTSADSFLL